MSEIDLARRVIAAYAEGLDGLTDAACRELVEEGGLSESQCGVLMDELNRGSASSSYELGSRFSEAGLSGAFIGELLGEDGERAFYRRARWLVDNYSRCPLDDPAECKEWKPSVIHNLGSIHLRFSENPAPPLIRSALRDKSPEVRRAALNAADHLHGVCDIPAFASFLSDDDAWTRDLAVRRIGENLSTGCGDSSLAYRRLMAVLQNEEDIEVRASALGALANMGPYAWRAAPYLLELTRTGGDYNTRYALMKIVCGRTIPVLIEGLKDEDPEVRQASLDAMASIDVEREKSEYKSAKYLRRGTYALADIESALAPAVPVLVRLMETELERERGMAIVALGKIGKTANAAVPAIAYYLKNDTMSNRRSAAAALARIGTDESFLALAGSMHGWGFDFGIWLLSVSGAESLGREAAPEAAMIFSSMLDSEAYERRLLAALALVKIRSETARALPLLIKALRDEGLPTRLGVPWAPSVIVDAIGDLGADAEEAVPALVQLWKEGDQYFKWRVISALGKIGHAADPALMEIFDSYEASLETAETIIDMTGAIDSFVPFLVKTLSEHENTWARSRAAELLGCERHSDAGVVPALIGALEDSAPAVRISAAGALGKIGARAVSAVPHLEALLRDDVKEVRAEAARALRAIGRRPKGLSGAGLKEARAVPAG